MKLLSARLVAEAGDGHEQEGRRQQHEADEDGPEPEEDHGRRQGDHPMHHPFHVHGPGRCSILSRDGVVEPNLVWKDTVLARTGETVDILLDVTNPARWMAHCHIAEHPESGTMFSFDVSPRLAEE